MPRNGSVAPLRVETLIEPGALSIELSIYSQCQNCVRNMYFKCMHVHRQEFLSQRSDCLTFLLAVVFRSSSYLATTVRW